MNDGSGFCGSFFRRSGAFLLLTDLVEAECQSGDRGQEGAENLGDESVLAGKLAEALKLLDRQDGAFNEAALDFQNVLVLLGTRRRYEPEQWDHPWWWRGKWCR